MSAALRLEQHRLGREQMRTGDFAAALTVFQAALQNYGPHVGLLSDLACSYYLLGRSEDYLLTTQILRQEFLTAQPLLSVRSCVQTALVLAKLLEEQGDVEESLRLLVASLDKCQNDGELKLKIQVQLLRLRSFLGIPSELASLHQVCLQSRVQTSDLEIELEHGLMLAELQLFGTLSGLQRILDLQLQHELISADLRLLAIDFIEHSLWASTSLSSLNLVFLQNLPEGDFDAFERAVFHCFRYPEQPLDLGQLNALARQVPPLGLLRLYALTLKLHPQHAQSLELKRKFLFLLQNLPADSRTRLLQKWSLQPAQRKLELVFELRQQTLRAHDRELSLKPSSFGGRCLQLLSRRREVPLDEFVRTLFDSDFNLSYYDRVRMALQRFNRELSALTGLPKTLLLQKSQVLLNEEVEVKLD